MNILFFDLLAVFWRPVTSAGCRQSSLVGVPLMNTNLSVGFIQITNQLEAADIRGMLSEMM